MPLEALELTHNTGPDQQRLSLPAGGSYFKMKLPR